MMFSLKLQFDNIRHKNDNYNREELIACTAKIFAMSHLPKPSHIPKKHTKKSQLRFGAVFCIYRAFSSIIIPRINCAKKQFLKGRKADEKLHKNIILHCGTERYDLVYRLRKQ